MEQFRGVQHVQQRPQDAALRHAERHRCLSEDTTTVIALRIFVRNQVKSSQVNDVDRRMLYVCIILETLLQLFNNFQCHTQIDL